jgi:transcriptional regulator with XRE-family HTH domain
LPGTLIAGCVSDLSGVLLLRSRYRSLSDFLVDQMVRHGIRTHRELGEFIGVAPATATRLLHGERVPKEETLQRIADRFDIEITTIRELAERPLGESSPFVLPREFDQLTPEQRDAVRQMCRVLLRSGGHRRVTRS